MQVLSTNRILKTSITKQSDLSKINIFREIGELASKGLPGLWRGIIPFQIGQFMHILPTVLGAAANTYGMPYGFSGLALGTLFANPFEVASVRYQNVQFSRGNILGDIWLMYSREKRALFTAGFFHAYVRNVIMMYAITNMNSNGESFVASFLFLTALSQPFEVLRVKQQWASQAEYKQLSVGENPAEGAWKVLKEQGAGGLFRGFVPRAAFFLTAGYILQELQQIREKREQ